MKRSDFLVANLPATYKIIAKVFENAEGETISKYCINRTVECAKKLLKEKTYSYEEIARMLRFSGEPYFFLQFKKVTGFTPKECRDGKDENIENNRRKKI